MASLILEKKQLVSDLEEADKRNDLTYGISLLTKRKKLQDKIDLKLIEYFGINMFVCSKGYGRFVVPIKFRKYNFELIIVDDGTRFSFLNVMALFTYFPNAQFYFIDDKVNFHYPRKPYVKVGNNEQFLVEPISSYLDVSTYKAKKDKDAFVNYSSQNIRKLRKLGCSHYCS
uniref:FCP1 homology domain-containing protein n=1 Tax=Rhabditophanes sp. KR3021 TaxID=114890 RepID=A0AC35TXA0_9BILA